MREIKYQAWHKQEKKMFQVLCIDLDVEFGGVWRWGKAYHDHDTGEHDADKDFVSWEHIELMQYTGLKDKSGKEIYEGDLVELQFLHPVKGPYVRQARVVWFNFHWWFQELEPDEDRRVTAHWLERKWIERCEIIGNIYEHPDLLTTN